MRPLVATLLLACAFVSTSASAQVVGGGPVHPGGAGGISRAMADSLYCARAGGTECPTGTGLAPQVTFWTGVHLIAGDSGFTYDSATDTLTVAGDVAVNGADVTTTSTGTATLFNTNATAADILGAATGAVNVAGGVASTGVTVTGNTGDVAMSGDAAVNGGDLTTTSTGTATLFNTNATAANILGAATGAVAIGGGSSSTGLSVNGSTGNGGVAGTWQVGDGAVGTPSLSFLNRNTTGFFNYAPTILGFSAAGVRTLELGNQAAEHILGINGGSLASGKSALFLTGTLTANSASFEQGISMSPATSGTGTGATLGGLFMDLQAGFTGADSLTTSLRGINRLVQSNGTNPLVGAYGSRAMSEGVDAVAIGVGAGTTAGVVGSGTGGAIAAGVWANSGNEGAANNGYRQDSTDYGLVATAWRAKHGSSTTEKHIGTASLALGADTNVAGYFGLRSTAPTFTSAAVVASNGATTSPIALLQDGDTTIVSWVDGGAQSTTSTIEALGGDAAATPNFSVEAGEGLYDCGTNCAALAANGADVIAGNATDATVFQKWKMDGGGHPAFAGSATTDAGTGSCHSVTVTGPAAAFQVSGVCNANQTIIVNFASTWTHSAPICVVSGADQNLTPSFDIRVSSTTSAATFFAKAALGDTIGDNVGTFNVHCAETF